MSTMIIAAVMAVGIEWVDEEPERPAEIAWASAVASAPSALAPLRLEIDAPKAEPAKPEPVVDPIYSSIYDQAIRDGTGVMVAARMEASMPYWRTRARDEGRTFCVDDAGVFSQGIHRLDSKLGRMWRRISHLYAGPNYWKIERFIGPQGADIWTGRTTVPDGTYGNVVVVSPESFGCPACESLKGQLSNASVDFVERQDDSAGPWPRLFLDGKEIRPATTMALASVSGGKVTVKTKVKSKGAATRSAYAESSAWSSSSGSAYMMESRSYSNATKRRGLLRRIFGRRGNRARFRMRSSGGSMRMNYAAAGS